MYFNFHKTEFSENSDYMVEMKGRAAISLNVQLDKTTNLFIGSTYIVKKNICNISTNAIVLSSIY